MATFKIVAHRGVCDTAPENTIPAFERAIELGADAIELDVRLTRDHVPVVYHYFYLDELTYHSGPVFDLDLHQLLQVRFRQVPDKDEDPFKISTLREVLEVIGGRAELEIEIKGPEPEAPHIIGGLLGDYRHLWDSFEVTSFEPRLLLSMQEQCPGIAADLLFPRSEPWMGLDVVAYTAVHRARLARARAVHLHPTQLSGDVVERIRRAGIEIHAWDVNDERSLHFSAQHHIPIVCTDRLELAMAYRASHGA
jgi:glycerophosphoryl diester phosphodiesterase